MDGKNKSFYLRISTVPCLFMLLTVIFAPLLSAAEITTTHVVDRSAGLDAVVITVPKQLNTGFDVLDVPVKKQNDNIRKHWNSSRYRLMINGGYFEQDFSSTGYYRLNGTIINKAIAKSLSGFVAVDEAGSIAILTRSDSLEGYSSVIQSGPFVIDPSGKIGIRSHSGRRAKRTLIGMTRNESILVIVTEPIYLLDLAHAVKKHVPDIERLLNLDGGPSTALEARGYEIVNEWPVRNYILKRKTQIKPVKK